MPTLKAMQARAAARKPAAPPSDMDDLLER
jgi:hypothetical protein